MKQNTGTKNRIRIKLRSERGASISFALLLFLVCAALSAVILVAATTAAGRMAGVTESGGKVGNIAKSDQKYYAVTSAARLLHELMGSETITMVYKKGKNDTVYSYVGAFDVPSNQLTDSDVGISELTNTDDTGSDGLSSQSEHTPLSENSFMLKIAQDCISGSSTSKELTISSDVSEKVSEVSADLLNVKVTETINGGILTFILSNIGTERPYEMHVEFAVEIGSSEYLPVTNIDDTVYMAQEISWHMTKMLSEYDSRILGS